MDISIDIDIENGAGVAGTVGGLGASVGAGVAGTGTGVAGVTGA